MTILFGGASYYFYRFHHSLKVSTIQNNSYNLLVGLDNQNSNFLRNLERDENILIMEKDKKNINIEEFKERGFGILIEEYEVQISKLNLDNLKNVIISTQNDRESISVALEILRRLKSSESKDKRIYINISNSDIGVLFKQDVITKNMKADILVYSLEDILVKDIFKNHTILGNYRELINSGKSYSIVIVGDSLLALRLIYILPY